MSKHKDVDYKKIAQDFQNKETLLYRKKAIQAKTRSENWIDLANHFQVKVQKRTGEVAFLQTKAGFLIAAAVVALQVISGLPKFDNPLEIVALIMAVAASFGSLIVSIISMHMHATSALKPEKMITDLSSEKHSNMSREMFGKWLAQSYSDTNIRFNKEYTRKYKQQLWSALLLVAAFAITIILKGVNTYV